MDKKQIIVDINNDGTVNAETFGFKGVGCVDELNKLMKNIASQVEATNKKEYYENEVNSINKVTIKK